MARIYRIKKVPEPVQEWFTRNFENCTYNFYWYLAGKDGRKIYGCEVYKNDKYYHNATQADLKWFVTENIKELARKYPNHYEIV